MIIFNKNSAPRRGTAKSSGFTLVEILVTVAIFSIVIAGNGVTNGSLSPNTFNVVGTALPNGSGSSVVAAQSIKISGNGQLRAAV